MKTHFLSIMLIVFSISTYAQKNKEQIKALKVAHITDRLSLTEKEAQQFWPIYNAYDDATSKIRHKEMREIRKEIRQDTESLSDKEANDLLERFIDAESRINFERIQLVVKLRSVISAKKILLLKVAEDDFKHKMFEEYKKRKGKRP